MAATGSPERSLSPEIARLELKLAQDPQSKVFIPLAEQYVKVGMLQEAVNVLEEGLKVFPAFITALVALGRTYYQMDLLPNAKARLEEAVKLSPENLLAHRTLAQIYVQENDLESADRSCQVMLSANPKDEESVALKALIDQRAGRQPSPASVSAAVPSPGLRLSGARQENSASAQRAEPAGASSDEEENRESQKVARLRDLLATIQRRRLP